MMPSVWDAALQLSLQDELKLRTLKPTNGYCAYLWRMVRFHSAIDPTMPTTCFFDLQREIDKEFGEGMVNVSSIINQPGHEILDKLDKMVDELCTIFGLDPRKGVERWRGLLY